MIGNIANPSADLAAVYFPMVIQLDVPVYSYQMLPVPSFSQWPQKGYQDELNLTGFCTWDVFDSLRENSSSPKIKKANKVQKKDRFVEYFTKRADELLRKLQETTDFDRVLVRKSEKPARSKNSKHPEKRSEYIGVSKNGTKWQALVVIGKHKVYMGSFKEEAEASTVFDFYSILTHAKDAKVNKSYTIREVLNMVHNFKLNNNDFKSIQV